MGASSNKASSNSNSNSGSIGSNNFSQNIPGFQQNALNDLYGSAHDLFGSANNQMQNQIGNVSNANNGIQQSALPAVSKALNGGVFGDPAYVNLLQNSLGSSLDSANSVNSVNSIGIPNSQGSIGLLNLLNQSNQPGQTGPSTMPSNTQNVYADIMGGNGNNYADAMKASYTADANRASANMLNNLDARATASGMSGGSRQGIAQSQGMYDINSNLQKNLAETGYNTFDKDLANKLGIASQADTNNLSLRLNTDNNNLSRQLNTNNNNLSMLLNTDNNNLARQQTTANNNLSRQQSTDTNSLSRQQMLASMLGQSQDTSNNAVTSLAPAAQNLGMGTFAPMMTPWSTLNSYASAVGAPTVLNNGSSNNFSLGSGNSNGKSSGASGGVK